MSRKKADQDSPWKEILERYFQQFMAFFFPAAHGEIDWEVGHEFLDKEFQKVVRDAKLGRRLLDKLVKVHLEDGAEAWVLIHVEVQGREELDFPKRMYVYHYRIFDRYDRRVASLAILADDNPLWRPTGYGYELWGSEARLKFPAIKLLDYDTQWSALEQNPNPFAIIVMAHLKNQATRQDARQRLHWKLTLVKMLYRRGYAREDILELFRFIDWVLILPESLEESFSQALTQYEEETKMPYLTSVERLGIKKGLKDGMLRCLQKGMQRGMRKGLQEGKEEGKEEGMVSNARQNILEVLEARFEAVSPHLTTAIQQIEDMMVLKRLLKQAALVNSLDDFETGLGEGV